MASTKMMIGSVASFSNKLYVSAINESRSLNPSFCKQKKLIGIKNKYYIPKAWCPLE